MDYNDTLSLQSQPGEIYSNGVTYYNTESQQHLPRSNPPLQKRPKAAIPIVPPPEREKKKEGGVIIQDETLVQVMQENMVQEQELVVSPINDEPSLQNNLKDEQPQSIGSSDNDDENKYEMPSHQEMAEQEHEESLETDTSSNDTHLQQDISKDTTLDVVSNTVDLSENDTMPTKEEPVPPSVDSLPAEQDKYSEVIASDQVSETPSTAVTVS